MCVSGQAVDRLGETGRNIRTELREQDDLLNHLDGEIGTSTEKMNVVQATLAKLLNTKDGCQIWTIVILGLILILLSKRIFSSFLLPLNKVTIIPFYHVLTVALVIWT